MRKNHPLLVGLDTVKPYKVVTGSSLYTVTPPAMQIEDFLPAASVMGLTAQPGIGKTWLALEICKAVTSGSPFLERFKSRRGGVLFVGSDSSLYDYARQWTRLTSSVDAAAHVFEPARFLIQSPFMFEDRDEVRRLIATHRAFEWGLAHDTDEGPQRERGFHVIVFDTLSALTNVPENDNTGREQVFRMIRLIAEATNAAIVVLHHNAARSEHNDGTGFRGGTAQLGRLDSHINLTPSTKDAHRITVTYKKFRGITPPTFVYKMNVSDPLVASLAYDVGHSEAAQKRNSESNLKDATSDLIKVALADGVKRTMPEIRDLLWPKVQPGAGADQGFADLKKLDRALRNRMPTLLTDGVVTRGVDVMGKPHYYMEKPCVPSSSETSTGGSTDSKTSSSTPASPGATTRPSTGKAKKSKSSKSETSVTSVSPPAKRTRKRTSSPTSGTSSSSGATTTEPS